MPTSPADEFDVLALTLLNDADADVVAVDDGLAARGVVFARLEGPRLALFLSDSRAADLVGRGAAHVHPGQGRRPGTWVLVADVSTWGELAAEAHQFAGEPAVGSES